MKRRVLRRAGRTLRTVIEEKDLLKRAAFGPRVVISHRRVIVLAFAAAGVYRVAVAGVPSWPEAALYMATVVATPLLDALARLKPETTVDLVKVLVGRIGIGGVARVPEYDEREPSKYDDHREESQAPC